MAVSNPNVIDVICTNRETGDAELVMAEPRDWSVPEGRITQLCKKIENYLTYCLSGQMLEERPQYAGKAIKFLLMCAYVPPSAFYKAFRDIEQQLARHRISFLVSFGPDQKRKITPIDYHETDDDDSNPLRKSLSLTVENEPVLAAPTPGQIGSAVDRLTTQGGPGFVILTGRGEDYAQAAGGDGQFTAEWREYNGDQFRHWVAGLAAQSPDRENSVATNSGHITARNNESLDAHDVKTLLGAYLAGKPRPEQYAWRDATKIYG